MAHKITEMYAFVMANTTPDGDEGIAAFSDPRTGLMMPMVGSDMNRVYSLLPIARRLFPGFKVMRFASAEDITQKIMDNG